MNSKKAAIKGMSVLLSVYLTACGAAGDFSSDQFELHIRAGSPPAAQPPTKTNEASQPSFVVETDPETFLQTIHVEFPNAGVNGQANPLAFQIMSGLANVTVLAREITYGAGGPDVSVGLDYALNGGGFSQVFAPAVNIVSQQTNITLTAGDLVFKGKAAYPEVSPFFLFDALSDTPQAIIFMNGTTGSNIYNNYDVMFAARGAQAPQPPFGPENQKQKTIWEIIQSSFNPTTHNLTLPTGEMLILFELGGNDPTSPAYDFQDLVIKVRPGLMVPTLWVKNMQLENAERLERFGSDVFVYNEAAGATKTLRINSVGTITQVATLAVPKATDFVISDNLLGDNPAFFGFNSIANAGVVLKQTGNYSSAVVDCFASDFTGDVFFDAHVSVLEYFEQLPLGDNVLAWDTLNQMMRITGSNSVQDCYDAPIHSFDSDIAAVTGGFSADLTAIAEDRMGGGGDFLAFDRISQGVVAGSYSSDSYVLFLSKAQLTAATGTTSVNLGGGILTERKPGSLVTKANGDVFAWDRVSKSLLFYKASNQSLTRILTQAEILPVTGGAQANIVDIDLIAPGTLVLLDAFTGSVLQLTAP